MAERKQRSRIGSRIADLLLTVLAFAGAWCIVLVILGLIFDVSIMMFRTGSMSPTIPAGSIAFVREIPATEISEGDIVTVDRGEDILPVTHRVVEIEETDLEAGTATFEMRGDANEVIDPDPYTASDVRRVMFSAPGVAHVVQWFGNPLVLGGLTVGASILVVWAFWPRPDDGQNADGSTRGAADLPSYRARHTVAAPALVIALMALPAQTAPPSAAHALPAAVAQAASGEHLRMSTSGDSAAMLNLSPGDPVVWTVGVWADAPEPGLITLDLSGSGSLTETPGAIRISVEMCDEQWTEENCAGTSATLLDDIEVSELLGEDDAPVQLTEFPAEYERWLRITASLSSAADELNAQDQDLSLRVHASGFGDTVSVPPPDPGEPGDPAGPGESLPPEAPGDHPDDHGVAPDGDLPRTGISGWVWLGIVAGGALLILVGTALVSRSRARTAVT
ncbi:hypothetical protein GCM10022261_00290 [Brevibacterium daeguense]|uniref:Signal peptidase I n=1 Tax=Brevibacterium daeguense TaxID=909936 RepID=A0ABP8EES8_9MICO|nr:signal peptidase I [Brevibacterium daeguense]